MIGITIDDQDRGRWALFGPRDEARVLVVLAGAGFDHTRLRQEAARCVALVAADAGAALCVAAGLMPDSVVGDFDSLPAETRAKLDPTRFFPSSDQETNDLEKALVHVVARWGADSEVVLAAGGGVHGGRMDHALANLGPVVREPHGRISMVDGEGRLFAVRRGRVTLDDLVGRKVSLLPWTLHGVIASESGLRYPLESERLQLGGRGVSNEIVEELATVAVEDGVALVWVEA